MFFDTPLQNNPDFVFLNNLKDALLWILPLIIGQAVVFIFIGCCKNEMSSAQASPWIHPWFMLGPFLIFHTFSYHERAWNLSGLFFESYWLEVVLVATALIIPKLLPSHTSNVSNANIKNPKVPDLNRKQRKISVAMSGGGIRSACFQLGVLEELIKSTSPLRYENVDCFSTVSGAGYTMTAFHDWLAICNDEGKAVKKLAKKMKRECRYISIASRTTMFAACLLFKPTMWALFCYIFGKIVLPDSFSLNLTKQDKADIFDFAWMVFFGCLSYLLLKNFFDALFEKQQKTTVRRVFVATLVLSWIGCAVLGTACCLVEVSHQAYGKIIAVSIYLINTAIQLQNVCSCLRSEKLRKTGKANKKKRATPDDNQDSSTSWFRCRLCHRRKTKKEDESSHQRENELKSPTRGKGNWLSSSYFEQISALVSLLLFLAPFLLEWLTFWSDWKLVIILCTVFLTVLFQLIFSRFFQAWCIIGPLLLFFLWSEIAKMLLLDPKKEEAWQNSRRLTFFCGSLFLLGALFWGSVSSMFARYYKQSLRKFYAQLSAGKGEETANQMKKVPPPLIINTTLCHYDETGRNFNYYFTLKGQGSQISRDEHIFTSKSIKFDRAMAISGAAVSVFNSANPLQNFTMGLFNLNLSQWIQNPCHGNNRPWIVQIWLIRLIFLVLPILLLLAPFEWANAVGFVVLIVLPLGALTNTTMRSWLWTSSFHRYIFSYVLPAKDMPYLPLTDGGLFDNSGLFRLLQLKKPFIVVFDAEEDPNFRLGALSQALNRYCEFNSAATVENWNDKFYPLETAAYLIKHSEHEESRVLYIKAYTSYDDPALLRIAKQQHPDIPFTPTRDQFLSSEEFTAYCLLGNKRARDAIVAAKAWNIFPNIGASSSHQQ